MNRFTMNGYSWVVKRVSSQSPMLVDRTGKSTLATTDFSSLTVYISNSIRDSFFTHVLIHELGHCALFSYGLIDDIHKVVQPQYWIEAEEWVCNFIADYGLQIFETAYDIAGNDAWLMVPRELDRMIA